MNFPSIVFCKPFLPFAKIAGFSVQLALCINAFAAGPCEEVETLTKLHAVSSHSYPFLLPGEVGLETEFEIADIAPILISQNGKVGGIEFVHKSLTAPPEVLHAFGAENLPSLLTKDFNEATDGSKKTALLTWVVTAMSQNPGADRTIRGLEVVESLRVYFGEQPEFAWEAPNQRGQDMQIEIKMRFSNALASEVNQSVWTKETELLGKQRSHHLHILFKFHPERLSSQPLRTAAEFLDYVLRMNYLLEMQTILFRNGIISRVQYQKVFTFGPLDLRSVNAYVDYLSHVVLGESITPLDSTHKLAWLAMRGQGLYQDNELFGVEFRAANYKGPNDVIHNSLDLLQNMTGRFAHSTQESSSFRTWWDVDPASRMIRSEYRSMSVGLKNIFAKQWYQKEWSDVWSQYTLSSLPLVPGSVQTTLAADAQNRYLQSKMLFFDWSTYPVVAQDRKAAEKVQEVQARTIQKFINAGNFTAQNASSYTRDFLIDSGLYQIIFDSLAL